MRLTIITTLAASLVVSQVSAIAIEARGSALDSSLNTGLESAIDSAMTPRNVIPEARDAHVMQRRTGDGHRALRKVRRRKNGSCKPKSSGGAAGGGGSSTYTPPPSASGSTPPPADTSGQSSQGQDGSGSSSQGGSDGQGGSTDSQAGPSGGSTPSASATGGAPPSTSSGTQTGGGGGGGGGGDGALLPVKGSNFWTTASDLSGAVPMQDALKITYGHLPDIGTAPDGSNAMTCKYPPGEVGGTNAAMDFYAAGNLNNVDITKANEVLLSYSVWFDADFDFHKGGKLPGLYGGATTDDGKHCSGGSKRTNCFSTRLMWREDGAGEIYDYLPLDDGQKPYCNTPPASTCNPDYGDSIGRGSWTWQKGQWNTVAMRVKFNSATTAADGQQQIFINGQSVLEVDNLQIRVEDGVVFQGIMAQSFFGGSDPEKYAPSTEQHSFFKDWTLSVLG